MCKRSASLLVLWTFCVVSCSEEAIAQTDVIVSGYVYDSSTNLPLKDVRIEVEEAGDVTLTNDKGKYTIVISGRTEARITFKKEGYRPIIPLLKLTQPRLKHDVRLRPVQISIEMTGFSSGAFIKGKVEGLSSSEDGKYKILVYVLTDKWYIHPFAENSAGRGFAAIDNRGNWQIKTVWRGHQAYKVAFLLVSKDTYPPSPVAVPDGQRQEPGVALQNSIDSVTLKIIPAPEGI